MSYRAYILVIFACTSIALFVNGCKGGTDGVFSTPVDQSDPVITTDSEPVTEAVTGFPGFPAGDEADGAPRITAAQDNILNGSEAYAHHATANVSGTDLVLDSTTDRAVWGVWRWGTFGGSIVPLTVELDVDAGGGEYWLAVSYYRDMEWRIFGPLTESTYIHTYDVGINHVSPASGYSYVVLLADEGNVLNVHSLNMTADDDVQAPAAPTGLTAADIEGTRIQLTWDANAESDLDGYNLFSGPADGFDVNDPSADKLGTFGAGTTSFWVEDLAGDTEYHFRITAFDALANESTPSATCNATTLTAPTYPTKLHTTDIGGSTTSVAWDEPTAGPPLGYEIYTGPTADFEVGDAGVVKHNTGLVTDTQYTLTGLSGSTEYNCRVRSYYPSGTSPLSNVVTFTTQTNAPPKPAFTVSPQFAEKGETVLFNPFGTTDDDTPLEDLVFKWDYENDGTYDEETLGPEIVDHVFHVLGSMTTKLTVVDGLEYSTTRDFILNRNLTYFQQSAAAGLPGYITDLDTDPSDSRIAILKSVNSVPTIDYYNGSSWRELSTSPVDCNYIAGVTLSPAGVSVIGGLSVETSQYWIVYNYDGTSWSEVKRVLIAQPIYQDRDFDIAGNGRMSVAVIEAYITGGLPSFTHYMLYVWHEKADGTYSTANITLSTDFLERFEIKRNDTTTYVVYGHVGDLHVWEFTDSGNSDTVFQTYSGDCDLLNTSLDHDNDTHLAWSFATDSDQLYYGDNYGSANGSQDISLDNFPTSLVGTDFNGDNEALIYWIDEQPDGEQRLLKLDTVSSGTPVVLEHGGGLTEDGYGQYYDNGSQTGVFSCIEEARDGELVTRFIVGGTVAETSNQYVPSGDDANVLGFHFPLVFTDDSVLCLDQQQFATARASSANSVAGPFTDTFYGNDSWCVPQAACITGELDEFFVGGYRNMVTDPALELVRYTKGTSEGTTEAVLADTSSPVLMYHPDSTEVLLVTMNAATTSLAARTWSGTTWSAPTTIYSGSDVIECYGLAPKGTEDWGLAFVDEVENTQLVERSSGTWGSASVISTETINGLAGIGIGYHTDGSLAVAVERYVVQGGIYLGTGPDGSSLTWERIAATTGSESRSIWLNHFDASPVVLFYLRKTPLRNSRVQVVEYFDDAWNVAELPDQLHGNPVGYGVDSNGNIVVAGYNMSADPRYSSIGVLMN